MRPRAHILNIGNEVLKGSVLNTNARFLGRELTSRGFEMTGQSSCRDVIPEICEALHAALQTADLIILSGGLGPTPDDLTREAVAEYFGSPLQFSKPQFNFIKRYYLHRKRPVPAIVKKEALFPEISKPLFNHFGIALGFYIWQARKMVVVLPGVPLELEKMFQRLVIPVLKKHFPAIAKRYSLIVKTVGLSEPTVMEKLKVDFFKEPFDFGIYPSPGEVTLRIYAEKKAVIQNLTGKVKKRLAGSIYAWEEKTLSEVIGERLQKKKKSVSFAESCTGGLLASKMTQTPGASRYFRGSVTPYHTDLKAWLGVSQKTLKNKGSISSETACELAQKVRSILKSDIGIGITGVAGPHPEEGKSPGCVFIAVASASKTLVYEENFSGDRLQIQIKSAVKALQYLWEIT